MVRKGKSQSAKTEKSKQANKGKAKGKGKGKGKGKAKTRVSSSSSSTPSLTHSGVRKLYTNNESPLTLQVLDVLRYVRDKNCNEMIEPLMSSNTQWIQSEDLDIYDIVISDGHHKTKTVLLPSFNELVQTGQLQPSSIIKVISHTLEYDETIIGHDGCSFLTNIQIISSTSSGVLFQPKIQTIEALFDDDLEGSIPLLGLRKYYVPMLNDDCPFGASWADKEIFPPDSVSLQDLPTIQDVVDSYEKGRNANNPYIVGRVFKKSRLIHKPHPNDDKKNAIPYHFTFEIVDEETPQTSVVVWNSACMKYFQTFQVGDAVLIDGYVIKPKYKAIDDEVEIVVNPDANIYILEEDTISLLGLPEVDYSFLNTAEMLQVNDGQVFDFVGKISFIGDIEREQTQSGQWTQFRWIQLVDEHAEKPLPLKLHINSQDFLFSQLSSAAVLLCTNIQMFSTMDEETFERNIYCKSTNDTQFFVDQQDFPDVEEVEKFLDWALNDGSGGSTSLLKAQLSKFQMHGFHRTQFFEHPTLDTFRKTFPNIKLFPVKDMISRTIQIQESFKGLVQGTMHDIDICLDDQTARNWTETFLTTKVAKLSFTLRDLNARNSIELIFNLYCDDGNDDTQESSNSKKRKRDSTILYDRDRVDQLIQSLVDQLVSLFPPNIITHPEQIKKLVQLDAKGKRQRKKSSSSSSSKKQQQSKTNFEAIIWCIDSITDEFQSILEDQRFVFLVDLHRNDNSSLEKKVSLIFNNKSHE